MSESSGIFTFPSTGIYSITANFSLYDNADFAYFEGFIRTTTDNSQKRFFSSDKGMEFSALTVRDIKWGRV